MYFVGASIQGEDVRIGGVWAPDDPGGSGTIFAVTGRARHFSDWPDRTEPVHAAGFSDADACASARGSGR